MSERRGMLTIVKEEASQVRKYGTTYVHVNFLRCEIDIWIPVQNRKWMSLS